MRCFVYGTLMQGFPNHRVMEKAGGRLMGTGYMKDMVMFNVASFPGIVAGKGTVHGEVYEVDDFAALDDLEGYSPNNSHSMYLRKTGIAVMDGKDIEVEYYYWNGSVEGMILIESGRWA